MEEVSDKDAEQFINDMMDKPRWQKSIFQTSMHLGHCQRLQRVRNPSKTGD
jgi:hypothetical protein